MELIILIAVIVVAIVAGINLYMTMTKKDENQTVLSRDDKNELKDSIVDTFNSNISLVKDSVISSVNAHLEKVAPKLDEVDKRLQEAEKQQRDSFEKIREKIDEKLEKIRKDNDEKLSDFQENSERKLSQIKNTINEQLTDKFRNAFDKVETELRRQRDDLKQQVDEMRENNQKKLGEIQNEVNEKLTNTLNERFKESFTTLSEQLEKVNQTMGEMKQISSDVGNLTRALSGVKTTGIFGETQLKAILDEILSSEQYAEQVQIEGQNRVDFAIKLPGKEEGEVYLPIDAKFPYIVYEEMQNELDEGNLEEYKAKRKQLIATIKNMANDIKEKYIQPPKTTNFAVMFLPAEGLYAEVVKEQGLLDTLRRDYYVTVSGPTTMAALLNSLQMGFQTLVIQRKSHEAWKTLSAVKQEFTKFGGLIQKVQSRLQSAVKELDDLSTRRTRAIDRALRNVELNPQEDSAKVLGISNATESEDEDI